MTRNAPAIMKVPKGHCDFRVALPEISSTVGRLLGGQAAHAESLGTPWLFPGAQPGQHVSTAMGSKLRRHGLPSTSSARAAALISLAAELPAAVIADLLGHQYPDFRALGRPRTLRLGSVPCSPDCVPKLGRDGATYATANNGRRTLPTSRVLPGIPWLLLEEDAFHVRRVAQYSATSSMRPSVTVTRASCG